MVGFVLILHHILMRPQSFRRKEFQMKEYESSLARYHFKGVFHMQTWGWEYVVDLGNAMILYELIKKAQYYY